MNPKPHLVFVYNAESGIFNTVSDIAHKIFSPETYSCNLCALTYGNFAIRSEWKEYLESLKAEFEFLHRDELATKYGLSDLSLPAVLLKNGNALQVWIGVEEINDCHSLDDLKLLISGKLVAVKK